jgi:predicted site-specific integrase-resolvase
MPNNTSTGPANVFTEAEAAGWLKVRIFTLRKWRRQGRGPRFIRCGGRLIRYSEADINKWMEDNRFGSTADELSRSISN